MREIIEVKALGGRRLCVFVEHVAAVEEQTPTSSSIYLTGGSILSCHGSGPSIMAKLQNPINLLAEGCVIKETDAKKEASDVPE